MGCAEADRAALAADLLRGHPTQGFCAEAAIAKLRGKGIPASKTVAGHRFLRPRLDRRHPGGTGRQCDRRGIRDRARCPGLQDFENPMPFIRFRRRHRVCVLRWQLVELRHTRHDREQTGMGKVSVAGGRVLLGAVRRHGQRRTDQCRCSGRGPSPYWQAGRFRVGLPPQLATRSSPPGHRPCVRASRRGVAVCSVPAMCRHVRADARPVPLADPLERVSRCSVTGVIASLPQRLDWLNSRRP